MAVVDSLLRLIASQGADALIIAPGEAPSLQKSGVARPLSMPYPGDDIVMAMVGEVASETDWQALHAQQSVETRYAASDGVIYFVRLEPQSGGVRLVFRRPDASDADGEGFSVPEQRLDIVFADVPVCEPGALRGRLARARVEGASDILLSVGKPPYLRVGGEVVEVPGEPLAAETLLSFVDPALDPRIRQELASTGSTDLAVLVNDHCTIHRYRANLFRQHHGLSLALRAIRRVAPTLRELNLPDEMVGLVRHRSGLVLMTGATGSGKSTTLVALLEYINRTAAKHVITLEDPIEYEYTPQRALIHQREVGTHVDGFSTGLRAALRESPDVILLGEMRDHVTISAALTAAETGHLVLSTLHASGAAMAVDRVIDVFPEYQQAQVRLQLAAVLRAVVTQQLVPCLRSPARAPAIELLRVNTAVASKIRDGRGHQLQSEIQKGRADGMVSFEASLASLVRRGLVDAAVAKDYAADQALLRQFVDSVAG